MHDLFGFVSSGAQDDEGGEVSPSGRFPNMSGMSFSGGGGAWDFVESAFASVGEEAVRSSFADLLAGDASPFPQETGLEAAFAPVDGGRDDDFLEAFAVDARPLIEAGPDVHAGGSAPGYVLDVNPTVSAFDRFSAVGVEHRGLSYGRAAFDNALESLLPGFDDDFFVLPRWMMNRR